MRREAEVGASARVFIEEIRDRAAFIALEQEWNALVAETDDQVFFRHEFFRVWLDNFAPEGKLRLLLLRGPGGRLEAALPLYELRVPWYGLPVRQLCSTANLHSCRFDLLARDPVAASDALVAWLAADRGWDVLRLTDVPEGGKAFELLAAARRYGLPTGVWESLRSPYIPLPRDPAEVDQRLDGKFKANLRRRRRKLEAKGAISLERIERGGNLEAALEEGLALERSGWKGEAGTAIAQDGPTRGFYSELARTAAGMGALALHFLRLDGRAVGFHYALQYGGRYLLLKPAYDESLRECSPGQLMMEEVLRACIERGLPEFDFLGPDMVWKRDWTDRVRPHFYLYIFRRSLLGRVLAGAKFRWIPAVKERVRRWKR
jgi:CelD/BcsL family acetyltransferase involved in cellulose biosynthesis